MAQARYSIDDLNVQHKLPVTSANILQIITDENEFERYIPDIDSLISVAKAFPAYEKSLLLRFTDMKQVKRLCKKIEKVEGLVFFISIDEQIFPRFKKNTNLIDEYLDRLALTSDNPAKYYPDVQRVCQLSWEHKKKLNLEIYLKLLCDSGYMQSAVKSCRDIDKLMEAFPEYEQEILANVVCFSMLMINLYQVSRRFKEKIVKWWFPHPEAPKDIYEIRMLVLESLLDLVKYACIIYQAYEQSLRRETNGPLLLGDLSLEILLNILVLTTNPRVKYKNALKVAMTFFGKPPISAISEAGLSAAVASSILGH